MKVTVCLILYNALEVSIDTLQVLSNFLSTKFIILTLRLKMDLGWAGMT